MNPNPSEKPGHELGRLYDHVGGVEPGAGLDCIIRARADQAVHKSRTRRLPWLGGLTTASVAVMAIALVLQQSPPGPPAVPETMDSRALLPESPVTGARPSGSREAGGDRDAGPSAPEVSARAEEAFQAPDKLREPTGPDRSEFRAHDVLPESDSGDAPTDLLTETGSRARMSDLADDLATPSTEEISEQAVVARLRALIEAGRIGEARGLLDEVTLAGLEPDLPEDLQQALHPPDDE